MAPQVMQRVYNAIFSASGPDRANGTFRSNPEPGTFSGIWQWGAPLPLQLSSEELSPCHGQTLSLCWLMNASLLALASLVSVHLRPELGHSAKMLQTTAAECCCSSCSSLVQCSPCMSALSWCCLRCCCNERVIFCRSQILHTQEKWSQRLVHWKSLTWFTAYKSPNH